MTVDRKWPGDHQSAQASRSRRTNEWALGSSVDSIGSSLPVSWQGRTFWLSIGLLGSVCRSKTVGAVVLEACIVFFDPSMLSGVIVCSALAARGCVVVMSYTSLHGRSYVVCFVFLPKKKNNSTRPGSGPSIT